MLYFCATMTAMKVEMTDVQSVAIDIKICNMSASTTSTPLRTMLSSIVGDVKSTVADTLASCGIAAFSMALFLRYAMASLCVAPFPSK